MKDLVLDKKQTGPSLAKGRKRRTSRRGHVSVGYNVNDQRVYGQGTCYF